MKLISLLKVMDDLEIIEINDGEAPIDEMQVFLGSVKNCKKRSELRHKTVTAILPCDNYISVFVNTEYQKRNSDKIEQEQ